MSNDLVESLLRQNPYLPVVVTETSAEDACSLAKALLAGGIKNVEITLRNEAALNSLRAIATNVEGMSVGAGTVFTAEQVEQCKDAGASYIVSPGYSETVHQACHDLDIAYIPGASTATEVQQLQEAGFTILKFFPAEACGGVKTLKALAPVFSNIQFCATGGISQDNAADYLALPNIIAVGMSGITPADAVKSRDWDAITRIAQTLNAERQAA